MFQLFCLGSLTFSLVSLCLSFNYIQLKSTTVYSFFRVFLLLSNLTDIQACIIKRSQSPPGVENGPLGFPHGCRVKSVCMEDKPVLHLSLKRGHTAKQTNKLIHYIPM